MLSVMLLVPLCGSYNISLGGNCHLVSSHHILTAFSNHVPWAIITACFVVSAALLLVLRFILTSENKRRDVEKRDEKYDEVYVTHIADGMTVEKKVDRVRVYFHRHSSG
jgi:hypothetical protein